MIYKLTQLNITTPQILKNSASFSRFIDGQATALGYDPKLLNDRAYMIIVYPRCKEFFDTWKSFLSSWNEGLGSIIRNIR